MNCPRDTGGKIGLKDSKQGIELDETGKTTRNLCGSYEDGVPET